MDLGQSLTRHPGRWATALIAAAFLLRLAFVATGQLNLVQDEAQYWDWTRHLQLTYYSKGGLIAWLIWASTRVFGDTELGVRFPSILGLALAQGILYLGVSRLFHSGRTALATVFVFTTMPLFMALGVLMTTDNAFVVCWAAALFCLYAASVPELRRTRPWWLAGLALSLGVGILAKYTMLGFPCLAVAYWLGLRLRGMAPRGLLAGILLATAAGLALGFLPTFLWNVQNDFVGYKHVLHLIGVSGERAGHLVRFDQFPVFLGSQAGLATPWWLAFLFWGCWLALLRYLGRDVPGWLPDARQSLLLLLFCLPVWGFFFLWSFHAKVLANWSTVSYVSGTVLAAAVLDRLLRLGSGAWARFWRRFAIIAAAVMFTLVFASPILPVPDSVNPTHRLKGWEDLGRRVEEARTTLFDDPDKVFIVSPLYDVTAALAFYTPGQPRVYNAWMDRRMNQYDLWPGPGDERIGWDAIYVRKRFQTVVSDPVHEMFERVGEPIHVQTTFKGQPARRFTLFPCYGFNGYWPHRFQGEF